MAEIGAALREARMRERIDVSEIEAQTKIRAKYLRALENEEWDLLPGPTFVKSFLRTYAQALGLDGRAMVEEYKLHYERPEAPEPERRAAAPPAGQSERSRETLAAGSHGRLGRQPGVSTPRLRPRAGLPRQRLSRVYIATVSAVGVVIVLLLYALLAGGGSSPKAGSSSRASRASRGATARGGHTVHGAATASQVATLASLKVEPTAEVYVCLMGDGRQRIPGVILTPSTPTPTYHAHRFELTLGNNAETLVVNGQLQTVPASATAIGYTITKAGMTPLAAAEEPTCR